MPLSGAGSRSGRATGRCGNGRGCDGESLKTVNARRTVMRLADSLGDFIVTRRVRIWNPSLRDGRGRGGAFRARRGTVLNIDIGGGTSQPCGIPRRSGH